MNIAVVDDEQGALEQITGFLEEFSKFHKVRAEAQCFSSGEEFLDALEPGRFQVVFMDIYLGGLDGTQAAKALWEKDPDCMVVFLTVSMEHMQDAFACHAFEYVVKPASQERIFAVLEDALEKVSEPSRYIEFVSRRKKARLQMENIVSAISDGHYLLVQDISGVEYPVRMTCSQFLGLVQGDGRFLLINKGVLVNMRYIESMEGYSCILADGRRLPIKVRGKNSVEQAWWEYNFEKMGRPRRGGSGL